MKKWSAGVFVPPLNRVKEVDPFIRFFRSIRMGNEYIAKRIHLYPEHWNHIEIEGRIKFRMLAKEKIRNLQQTH